MKRRFAFRLARVQRIRELEERMARSEWGAAQARANEAATERDRLRAELIAAREELRALLGPDSEREAALDPRAVALAHELLDRRVVQVKKADELTLTLQGQAERLAQAWREHDTRRQALERLEDRDRKTHYRERERQDAKEQDERSVRPRDTEDA